MGKYTLMNNKLKQLEIQKLMQEYSYLILDAQYKDELIDDARNRFMETVRDIMGKPPTPQPTTQDVDQQQQQSANKKTIDPSTVDPLVRAKVKQIYRSIAKVTHPDRATTDEHVDAYVRATKAADEFDLFELYGICALLGIHYIIDFNDKPLLQQHIKHKREQLKSIEQSYIWLWANAETQEEQDRLVKQFIDMYGDKV